MVIHSNLFMLSLLLSIHLYKNVTFLFSCHWKLHMKWSSLKRPSDLKKYICLCPKSDIFIQIWLCIEYVFCIHSYMYVVFLFTPSTRVMTFDYFRKCIALMYIFWNSRNVYYELIQILTHVWNCLIAAWYDITDKLFPWPYSTITVKLFNFLIYWIWPNRNMSCTLN